MRDLVCLRCQTKMQYVKQEQIQLGKTGWILGDWPNILAGALTVDIYACLNCGKIEFFQAYEASEEKLAQRQCPRCGKWHDFVILNARFANMTITKNAKYIKEQSKWKNWILIGYISISRTI